MRNLFAYLVCVGVSMRDSLLENLLVLQNPHRQRRGGFGYGIFASVQAKSDLLGTLPRSVNIRINSSSKLHLDGCMGEYQIHHGSKLVASVSPFKPAEWMARILKNGRRVSEVVQQHTSRNLVGIIGGTRCRLFDEGTACGFCSMQGSPINLNRSVEDTIEALRIILEYRQDFILTLTTPLMTNKDFVTVCDSLAEVKAAFPSLPLALESQPVPSNLVTYVKSSGVDTWMIPVDCLSTKARDLYVPGKKTLLDQYYWSAIENAVRFFGEGGVTSNIIVGLEDEELTKTAIREIVARGVIPEPLPIRPTERLQIETDPSAFVRVQGFLREEMQQSGLASRMRQIKSGCAACGGCGGGISANMLRKK